MVRKTTILSVLLMTLLSISFAVFSQDAGITTLDDIIDDPDAYFGQEVTVEEEIIDTVGEGAFVIEENELLPDTLLVLTDSNTVEGLNITQLAEDDILVAIEGTIQQFATDMELELDIPMDNDEFANYEGDPVLIASNIVILEQLNPENYDVPSLDAVLDEPEVFYGDNITVQQNVVNAVSPNAFELQDEDALVSEELLILYDSMAYNFNMEELADEGALMRVSGQLIAMNEEAVDEIFDVEFDVDLFDDYDQNPVLLADSVAVIQGMMTFNEAGEVTLDAVLDNPASYYGEVVTVSGEISEIFASRTLVVEDSDLLNSENILVLLNDGTEMDFMESFAEDDQMQITGTIYQFVGEDFDEGLEIDFDDPFYDDWETGTAIVADEVTVVDED